MDRIFIVGAGGFIGTIFRYIISGYVHKVTGSIGFPFGTLAVNLIGCFFIGMCSQLDELMSIFSTESRMFLFIGIFGGFTTYSSFGNETMNLIHDKNLISAFINVSTHIAFGLFAVWAGRLIAYFIWR